MVCCDSCQLWVHFRCDPREAPKAAREGDSCHYSCPACRWAAGSAGLITELAAAEAALRAAAPKRAKSAYNLFSADAHKTVGAGAMAAGGDFKAALRAVAEAWRASTAEDRAPYEREAKVEAELAAQRREAFKVEQARYLAARTAAAAAGVIDAEGRPVGEAAAKEAAEAAVELRKRQLEETAAAAAAAKKRKETEGSVGGGSGGSGAGKKKKSKKKKEEATEVSPAPLPPPLPPMDINGGVMAAIPPPPPPPPPSIRTPAADSLGCLLLPALSSDGGGDGGTSA